MINTLKKRLDTDESGFTLVELLVVMIIIAILMAIAVPIFLSQKNKAVATGTKSDVTNVGDWFDSCAASATDGSYTNCTPAQMKIDEPGLYAAIGSPATFGVLGTGAVTAAVNPGNQSTYTIAYNANGYEINGSTRNIAAGGQTGYAYYTLVKDSTGSNQFCNATQTSVNSQLCPPGGKW